MGKSLTDRLKDVGTLAVAAGAVYGAGTLSADTAYGNSFADIVDNTGVITVRHPNVVGGPQLTIDGAAPTVHTELLYLNSSGVPSGYATNPGLNVPGFEGLMDGIYNDNLPVGGRPTTLIGTADFNQNGKSWDLIDGDLIFENGEAFLPSQITIGGVYADQGGMLNMPVYPVSGSADNLQAINMITPEPSTGLLVLGGLTGMAAARSSKRTRSVRASKKSMKR